MSKEVDAFLKSKLNLQIGTINWFNYDKDREKFLIITPKAIGKSRIYETNLMFISIDDGNFSYKGVKGKGIAIVVDDPVWDAFLI